MRNSRKFKNLKGNHAANALDPDATKSLEYDDLNKFRDRTPNKISTLRKSLKQLSTEVSKVSGAIQEYSYSYNCNLKLVGVRAGTTRNCLPDFAALLKINVIGVGVKPYDIDIAHRIQKIKQKIKALFHHGVQKR